MATLVSPGVSVTVTDESFYIPQTAPTVPLLFIATEFGKTQMDGVTPAVGTREHSVVRTITSIRQSLQLYGTPVFRRDLAGNEFHGDARNEYGLLALNNALGQLNRAYVVRANVDLTDAPETFISYGIPVLIGVPTPSPGTAGNAIPHSILAKTAALRPQTITIRFTTANSYAVTGDNIGFIGSGILGPQGFNSVQLSFDLENGEIPFVAGDLITFDLAYQPTGSLNNVGNGTFIDLTPGELAIPEVLTISFLSSTQFSVTGTISVGGTGNIGTPYDNGYTSFTIIPGTTPFSVGDSYTITVSEVTSTNPLGATDAARRVAIVQALQAEINSNTEVRSEIFEYNLILCPGYWETVDEMNRLAQDVLEEAFVVADTPGDKSPEQTAAWARTSERYNTVNSAYYYPWALMSNVDGHDVFGAPSGVALRTIAYSDNVGYVWSAPAGANRGVVTGVSKLGYYTGTPGTATTFVEANLNQGQRDALYEFGTNINPIAFFPGRGFLVFGQKTSSPVASSLDRINVARLVCYLRRVIRKGAFSYVFEPNDETTRKNLKSTVDGILADVTTKRGLYDYATSTDSTVNTPDRVQRNELWCEVLISPTITAEFIMIPIRLQSVGEI